MESLFCEIVLDKNVSLQEDQLRRFEKAKDDQKTNMFKTIESETGLS
jgi:hypothetical protein